MRVAVACDHAGFPIKNSVIDAILQSGHKPIDLGTNSTESVDYVDFVEKLGDSIIKGYSDRGILVCGSGVGACIAANKIKGVYAAICHDPYSAHQGVEHDAMNVLCLGGRIIGIELVKELVPLFLNARFVGEDPGEERHGRRVRKTRKIEQNN
jgi:RpiB/LacA/LacB family sugar-phosphate isomerase